MCLGTKLSIVKVDWHLEQNRQEHHTESYENPGLIVRRGQTFTVTIHVNRYVDQSTDAITLWFKVGRSDLCNILDFHITMQLHNSDCLFCCTIFVWLVPGQHPQQIKGTLISVPVVDELKLSEWGCTLKYDSNSVTYTIMTSSHSIVGVYDVIADIRYQPPQQPPRVRRHKLTDKVILLFNAWCPGKLSFQFKIVYQFYHW